MPLSLESFLSDIDIWKSTVTGGFDQAVSRGRKLGFLLEQTKLVETVVFGQLKDALFDLSESVAWEFASLEVLQEKRMQVLAMCEEELAVVKREYLPGLARRHGVFEEYVEALKRPEHQTLADFETAGALECGLLVWRVNLKRDLAFAEDKAEMWTLVRNAYIQAEGMVKACIGNTHSFWNKQSRLYSSKQRSPYRYKEEGLYSPGGSPRARHPPSLSDAPLGGGSVITLYERAMSQVWLRLEALAQQHEVADNLRVFAQMERTGSHPLTFSDVVGVLRDNDKGYTQEVQAPPLHDRQAAAIAQALEGFGNSSA